MCLLALQERKEENVGSGAITDWVVQNLESSNSTITSRSSVKAGENDTLPVDGLVIGNLRILASDSDYESEDNDDCIPIRLLVGRNGWGTGVHPTTRLCLEWICQTIHGGETVLDYGCGSGILSIAALRLGANTCYGVDIEAEALVSAVRNVQNNACSNITNDGTTLFQPLHTREVLPFGIHGPKGVDVCIANILIGQLLRPSMIAALISNIAPGGLLCLSGIRPGDQIDSLKRAYGPHVEWLLDDYAELAASETPSSIESYGFDCGVWCRLVGRKVTTRSRSDEIASMSDLAVS
jgi:2-polyprenyl-3-methyl-5-hydroxy-6-metoxy-1,4-benzoquinol methylase